MANNDEERQRQRELLAKEEQEMRERQQRGVLEPVLTEKERKLVDRVVQLSAIAKNASRTKIAVRTFDDTGKPTTLEERIGNEDMIFQALLMTRLSQEGER